MASKKSSSVALCCAFRHCDVLIVRLVSQSLHASESRFARLPASEAFFFAISYNFI
jgi:hypothetical protein